MQHQFSMTINSKLLCMESCQKEIHNTDQAVARALVNEFKNTAYSFLSL